MIKLPYLRALAPLFSPPSIRSMATGRLPTGMDSFISESGVLDVLPPLCTNHTLIEAVYGLLHRHYRCEYIYKNAIANKILIGRHRLAGATMATELRCDNAKADFVILNGTSTVYEIKTELDNFDRLPNQLRAYRKMFDRVFVVAHPSVSEFLLESVEDDIGVLAMTQRGSLSQLRDSASHADSIDPGCIFDSLRRQEFIAITEKHFGALPLLPNTELYSYCRRLFLGLPPHVAHQEMVAALKNRFAPPMSRSFFDEVPNSLVAGVLGSQIKRQEALSLVSFLKLQYSPA